MNRVAIAGIVAAVLIAGFVFTPFSSGGIQSATAQVQPQQALQKKYF
jgi:hypothetical protein